MEAARAPSDAPSTLPPNALEPLERWQRPDVAPQNAVGGQLPAWLPRSWQDLQDWLESIKNEVMERERQASRLSMARRGEDDVATDEAINALRATSPMLKTIYFAIVRILDTTMPANAPPGAATQPGIAQEQSPLAALIAWHASDPQAFAVECYGEPDGSTDHKLTVDDVYRRALGLAQILLEQREDKQDSVVGLNMELESELYVAFFACWMSGRTPTVLNVSWPIKTYEAVVSRLNIHTILYTRLRPPHLANTSAVHTPSLTLPSAPPSLPIAPEPHFALINQSSGTTGLPKSVPVRTAMYAHFCPIVTPNMAHGLRAASVTAPSFSGVTAGIYLAPYTRTVCVYPGISRRGEQGYGAAEIAENTLRMLEKGVDSIGFTASLFGLFDSMLPAGRTFPGLRYASFGGELTSPAVLRAARARFPDATLTLGFSSTESVQGGFGTQFLPTADLSTLTEIVVRPNGNVEQLLLLDAADRPVELKPGATGRVAIVTAGSADPYLVAPEGQRTAQDEKDLQAAADTFRPAPNGRRLIVFGDRATYRPGPDGAHGLVVLGREGRRIKQNGVFLDLSALDAALTRALPDVLEDASTLAAGRVLVCLFVCKPGAQDDVTLERLNEALRVDTAVQLGLGVRIEKTPIASSGKKDWTALQARADEAAGEQLGDLPALAEADELARQVSDALADVLEEPRLAGRDAPLARVGVDSISAARLANALRTLDGGERVRVEDVLREDSSVSSIAARMRGDVADADEQISKTFLDAEVERLSANLPVLNMSAGDTNIKIIVLTGATGYLGSFILAELLLAHPEAQVICITRAGGLQRVLAALSRTRVEIPSGRIEANVRHVQGDLAAPQLGLGQADAEAVSQADLIIHNGALVHWTRPYGALRAANVDSLLALLALGRRDPPARLTFVSGGGQTALDSGVEDVFTGINGYTASKYVAEQLCARAGTGVRVVRPGYILGDPVCNGDDFLWRLARTAVELRCVVAPASDAPPMNAASVREVARTVLAAPQALERIWVECSLSQLWAAIRRAGYTLEDVDEATWSARLEADLASRGAAHPLVALAAFARDGGGLRGGLGYPRPADLPRKTLPDAVLDGCVRYLWQAGEMPAPDGSWRAPEDRIGRSGR